MKEIGDLVAEALSNEDWDPVLKYLFDISEYCGKDGKAESIFPRDAFEQLCQLMYDPRFHDHPCASDVVHYMESEFARFDSDQRTRLLIALEHSFDRFKDPQCAFQVSELLGEYFANADSFRALERLEQTVLGRARRVLPHGFEHIVRDCADSSIAMEAFVILIRLAASDDDPQTREEAKISLWRIDKTAGESWQVPRDLIKGIS